MTIAAKLSRTLYETFGEESAEAMIDWMQTIDTHRSELRELNDLAFSRFDARLTEQVEGLRGEMHAEIGGLRTELRSELGALGTELRAESGALGTGLRGEIAALRSEVHADIGALRADITGLRQEIGDRYGDLLKWSFTFWIGSTISLVLALLALSHIGR
ncbi:MAG TPA: hypothetical protein VMH39_12345 [Gemmatimonadaceae bacterium]|nr:hypothetical protein [Gemmatimonadaceae bacterium]